MLSYQTATVHPEFHEGMAAGLLIAIEMIDKNGGGLDPASAQTLMVVIIRCIDGSTAVEV